MYYWPGPGYMAYRTAQFFFTDYLLLCLQLQFGTDLVLERKIIWLFLTRGITIKPKGRLVWRGG